MPETSRSRSEADYLGTVDIPGDALYGVHTLRGVENLSFSRRPIGSEREFARAFAYCKWAAALANHDLGVLDGAQCEAIVQASRELAEGQHDQYLIVDFMEGSGGTSSNMNVNEVLANRAQQLLGGQPGIYDRVHPNDHVNRSQSTNDVYPAAMKIAAHTLLAPMIDEVRALAASFRRKADEFQDVLHLGRTCLQDAQPMTLGQLFGGYAALTARLAVELTRSRDDLRALPLGGTAIGTGFGAPKGYKARAYAHLANITGVDFHPADDAFDAMQNLDTFTRVSAELRTCATSLGKIASDLILLSSGPNGGLGELELPAVQAGSSIMPGKINPVLPMAMVQIGFAVTGNDVCVAQANQGGQLEINHFEPVVADRLYDSIRLLHNGIRLFREKCVDGIRANVTTNERHLLQSSAIATALIPTLGYAKVSAMVRQAATQNKTLLDALQDQGLLAREQAIALTRESTIIDC
ncbi:aspartate ammonia-lyase [Corticimicrobacter populi]|uniref:Aspartate ammonia-lyase n=1 Tax=Corticimicrobacter populi TaxID=2175229 RepID=A0A2V1JW10_9BURK|nr:aspartate ammonia-lyase [Corticimicrobacter populi]PWF22527.1 aspartate ammonia-lyase [Corticimicrobacter populi]